MMTEHEKRERQAVRRTLKEILGIFADSGLSNPELAERVADLVRSMREQCEAYELAAILRDHRGVTMQEQCP